MRITVGWVLALMLAAAPAWPDNGASATPVETDPPLVLIRGGTFTMGDAEGRGNSAERPAHVVTLSSFYLGCTEVTFASYDVFCDETRRDRPADLGWGRDDRPVVNVSWLDAVEYCNWLSDRHDLPRFYVPGDRGPIMDWSSTGYRLPTEAEWECAAEGSVLGDAWIQGRSGGRTRSVAAGAAGPLGLADMLGNVWEWCNDWYGSYAATPQANPRGPETGQYRVLRGGSWYDLAVNVRITGRSWHPPTRRLPMVGFRVARSAPVPSGGFGG